MKDYRIVHSESFTAVEDLVREDINNGWYPLGAPFISPYTDGDGNSFSTVCQAMMYDDGKSTPDTRKKGAR